MKGHIVSDVITRGIQSRRTSPMRMPVDKIVVMLFLSLKLRVDHVKAMEWVKSCKLQRMAQERSVAQASGGATVDRGLRSYWERHEE